MAMRYADRAFLSMANVPIVDLQSCQLRQNHNAREVPSMTPDEFNRGFVKGNRTIDVTATIAVENELARPKFEAIDYAANSVQITFVCGADQYVATGVFLKDNDDNAAGIGEEVKATFNFGALKLVDSKGNSSLFDIQL